MAKKKSASTGLDAVLRKPTESGRPAKKKITPLGVLLEPEELDRLESIVADLGFSRHAVLRYAVMDFIRRYEAGDRPNIKTETVTITKRRLDTE